MINDAEGGTLLKDPPPPLRPHAKSMRFDVSLVTEDPCIGIVFCRLHSLSLCPENEGIKERNEVKPAGYRAMMEIWNRYQQMKKAAEHAGDLASPEPTFRILSVSSSTNAPHG